MGGRGSSSGAGSGSWIAATSVAGSDGKPIDLSNNPLKYGKADSVLSGGARTSIEAFEAKRFKMKSEYSQFVDANGNMVGQENHGGKGSVGASMHQRNTAYAMSHNHPRDGGMLGGTFSKDDMSNFVAYNQTVYRATAVEGTYSIAKGAKFDGQGFRQYYHNANNVNRAKYAAAEKAARTAYNADVNRVMASNMSHGDKAAAANKAWNEYMSKNAKAFNTFLVENHNALIAGQQKYGYSYTLERRSGK